MKRKIFAIIALLLIGVFVFMAVWKNNSGNEDEDTPTPVAVTPNLDFSVINIYQHDTSSYTQGLVVYNGELYEGTGNYGKSKLLKTDLKTGKIEKQLALDSIYFGEGITILRDTVYQLTWKEKKVFAYTIKDFKKVKEFAINTEGWGITTDGTNLLVSDGSNNIYFYEPATFKLLKTLPVTENGTVAYNLNELEYIDGFVYANQYQLSYLLKIDLSNGQVVAKSDLTEIWKKVQSKNPASDVPNGVAYDSASKKIYITGKWWPDLYEIKFSQ